MCAAFPSVHVPLEKVGTAEVCFEGSADYMHSWLGGVHCAKGSGRGPLRTCTQVWLTTPREENNALYKKMFQFVHSPSTVADGLCLQLLSFGFTMDCLFRSVSSNMFVY